ncbi:hypothetical protein RBEAN4_0113 [Rickettsia bellii str. RML An4]|uniref:Uncharacterized protein n=1 Tax=Rickettsia bellii str. RML An4 TaxID=1359193 RepID=A0A0F3Q9A6_RICBE|nr:hypothetical protein RBEAN4_0113 [Rickettsia bellii str. RML An4]
MQQNLQEVLYCHPMIYSIVPNSFYSMSFPHGIVALITYVIPAKAGIQKKA